MHSAPTFFVVGAPKAGTTSLHRYLDQHPDVFMSPIKEPAFFSPEILGMMTARDHGLVLDWENYLELFRDGAAATARGESSVSYLASAGAPAAIARRIPDARIIMMLRNPVERLLAYYAGANDRKGMSFGDWIDREARREAARVPRYGRIVSGMYAQHLARYRSVFPAAQIRVYLYDDYCDRVDDVLADIFAFLDVDPGVRVNTAVRHNVTVRTSDPVPVPTAAERARVASLYDADIRALQDLLGRDLSSWILL